MAIKKIRVPKFKTTKVPSGSVPKKVRMSPKSYLGKMPENNEVPQVKPPKGYNTPSVVIKENAKIDNGAGRNNKWMLNEAGIKSRIARGLVNFGKNVFGAEKDAVNLSKKIEPRLTNNEPFTYKLSPKNPQQVTKYYPTKNELTKPAAPISLSQDKTPNSPASILANTKVHQYQAGFGSHPTHADDLAHAAAVKNLKIDSAKTPEHKAFLQKTPLYKDWVNHPEAWKRGSDIVAREKAIKKNPINLETGTIMARPKFNPNKGSTIPSHIPAKINVPYVPPKSPNIGIANKLKTSKIAHAASAAMTGAGMATGGALAYDSLTRSMHTGNSINTSSQSPKMVSPKLPTSGYKESLEESMNIANIKNAILNMLMQLGTPKFGKKLYRALKKENPRMFQELIDMYGELLKHGAVTPRQQMKMLQQDDRAADLAYRLQNWVGNRIPPEGHEWFAKAADKYSDIIGDHNLTSIRGKDRNKDRDGEIVEFTIGDQKISASFHKYGSEHIMKFSNRYNADMFENAAHTQVHNLSESALSILEYGVARLDATRFVISQDI